MGDGASHLLLACVIFRFIPLRRREGRCEAACTASHSTDHHSTARSSASTAQHSTAQHRAAQHSTAQPSRVAWRRIASCLTRHRAHRELTYQTKKSRGQSEQKYGNKSMGRYTKALRPGGCDEIHRIWRVKETLCRGYGPSHKDARHPAGGGVCARCEARRRNVTLSAIASSFSHAGLSYGACC